MPVNIESPNGTETSISAFFPGNPIKLTGSGDPAVPVSIRLEDADTGDVWDATTGVWVKDETRWQGDGTSDGKLKTDVADMSNLTNAQGWGGQGKRFVMEWKGIRGEDAIPNSTTPIDLVVIGSGTRQYAFGLPPGQIAQLAQFSLIDGRLELSFRDVTGIDARWIQSVPLVPAVDAGEAWGLRCELFESDEHELGESVCGGFWQLNSDGDWEPVEYDRIGHNTSNSIPTSPISWLPSEVIGVTQVVADNGSELVDAFLLDIPGASVGYKPFAAVSHGANAPGMLFTTESVRVIDQSGETIVDINVNRDARADIDQAFADPDGNMWQAGNTSAMIRTRESHWTFATGSQIWSWSGPQTDELYDHVYRAVAMQGASLDAAKFKLAISIEDPKERFVRRGIAGVYWATEMANYRKPTTADLFSAVRLCDVSEISGFTNNHEARPFRRATSTHTIGRPGRAQLRNPRLTLYDRLEDTSHARPLFDEGNEGFLILAPHGLTKAGSRIEVIPVISAGNRDMWTAANEAARIEVSLVATGAPARTKVVV